MNNERNNTLSIAKLEGEMKAIRAENEAMESRIDVRLAENKGAMDQLRLENKGAMDQLRAENKGGMDQIRAENKGVMDQIRAEIARRETRLLLSIAGMLTLAVSVMGLVVAVIAPWPES